MIKKPSLNGRAHCGHYCAPFCISCCSLKLKNSEKLRVTVLLVGGLDLPPIQHWLHDNHFSFQFGCIHFACAARSRDSFIRNRNTTIFGMPIVFNIVSFSFAISSFLNGRAVRQTHTRWNAHVIKCNLMRRGLKRVKIAPEAIKQKLNLKLWALWLCFASAKYEV